MLRFFQKSVKLWDESLAAVFQHRCLSCDRRTAAPLCPRCKWYPTVPRNPFEKVQSALEYQEPWRAVLHGIKYQGRHEWLGLFAQILAAEDFNYVPEPVSIVPVPLHRRALLKRGFNQTEWLAHRLPVRGVFSPDFLYKRKVTPAQSSLRKKERLRNLRGSFQCRGRTQLPAVLLVDDVLTTGSTIAAASDALLRAGVARIYAWTLFRA